MIGTGFGQYTITGHLGSGGMGDVYQATDSRLGRDVAVKFLSEAFVHDSSRLARFQREARALAALNHPYIATIYGFEEIGGRHFLVMELVRGTTLASKLASGRPALDDTIRYGTQIADALAAAHARGIVHRDLKPGNIMVTKSGVKVLDFGLAKSADHDETLTRTEVVMGTPAYMAPEQREGGTCDARSDIYSFGLILLEMATGRRVADGDSLKSLPPQLAPVIQGCLERDPDARWQSAADVKKALTWAGSPRDSTDSRSSRRMTWASIAAIVGIVAGATTVWLFRPAQKAGERAVFAESQSGQTALTLSGWGPDFSLTPDGSGYVYVGNGGTQLFHRKFNSREVVPIVDGTYLQAPVVSPAGQYVVYLDNAYVMKRVPINGGPSVTLPAVGRGGATWLDDDTIVAGVIGPVDENRGLRLIHANAPTAQEEELTSLKSGELAHVWPQALPDGQRILFTILPRGSLDAAQLAVFDMRTRKTNVVLRNASGARYVSAAGAAGEYLVYVFQGAVWTIPFDLGQLATRGTPTRLPARVVTDALGSGQFAVDGNRFLYVDSPANAPDVRRSVVWIDWASGKETAVGSPGPYSAPRISPDGSRIAMVAYENRERSIGIIDVRNGAFRSLRVSPVSVIGSPLWLQDSKRIIFQGSMGRDATLWVTAVDGTGSPERLLAKPYPQLATSVSRDGHVVFHEAIGRNVNILQLTIDGSRRETPLLNSDDWEINGVLSPNGRWLAFECCSDARAEIHVAPYPSTGEGRWIVSSGGGRLPAWSPNSDQLFYVAPDGRVMRAAIERADTFTFHPPEAGHQMDFTRSVTLTDVSADGRQLLGTKLAIPPDGIRPPLLVFEQNWIEALAVGAK